MIDVRDPMPGDEATWRALWDGYCAFYQERIGESVTATLWNRLLTPGWGVFARLATLRDASGAGAEPAVVGIAHVVVHPGTWSTAPNAYLEDLYVSPEARGRGVGDALIADLAAMGRQRGWNRLYWHTRANNDTARRLYDRHARADDFVRYVIPLE